MDKVCIGAVLILASFRSVLLAKIYEVDLMF